MRNDQDHTRIELQTNVKRELDPTVQHMSGTAIHGNTPFDVPFISNIEGNLWQGGCQNGLQLPHFFKHVISLYPWEQYTIKHDLNSFTQVKMYDSLDQAYNQVDVLAKWVNECVKDGPTLVHCQAGLNRSSLVAARSLMLRKKNPLDAQAAIDLLRAQRSPACLCNKAFEAWLHFAEELDKISNVKLRNDRIHVSFTPKELDITIEAAGAYKSKLVGKATKMRNRHGVNPKGKYTLRAEHLRTAQHKLCESRKKK